MADMRIDINRAGIKALLRSPTVLADLVRRAHRVAATAGPGMRVDSGIGRNRARAAVITDTREAQVAEATRRVLTRAIEAGR